MLGIGDGNYHGDAAVSWTSSMQRYATLFTAEAEYIALGEEAMEALFTGSVPSSICPELKRIMCPGFRGKLGAIP